MALLPYILDPLMDDYDPLNRLYDQNFGLGFSNDELQFPRSSSLSLMTPFRSGYLRTLRHLHPEDSGISSISNNKDEFKVSLDVQQFKPEEVKVKITDDYIIIEGKHEEREDKHGFISREFSRKYKLPPNVKREAISSTLSSDGLLSVVAPKDIKAIKQKEREIKVVQTKSAAKEKKNEKREEMEQ